METRTPDPTPAPSSTALRSDGRGPATRRRLRALNLAFFLPLLAVVGVFLVIRQAQTWEQGLVLGSGVVAAMVAFERWTTGDVIRVAIPCLCVAAAVWPYGAWAIDGAPGGAYYSLAVVGSLVVPHLPRHRVVAAVGLAVYVAAVGAVGLLTTASAGRGDLIDLVVLPTGFTVVLTGLMFPNKGFYDVLEDLEAERDREAELALARERMRFASDLHDIQGHTLHVVKLKIALAQRLVHIDPARAEHELGEVYALVGDTIAHTKELAFGQRKLNLAAELENARNLLEAAGMHVRVHGRADVGTRPIDLLGQVLRETTTNILRHSRATLVSITLSPHGITVVNDGVVDDALPELRGLATLSRRVSDEGGELVVRLEGGRFVTAATFPALPSDVATAESTGAQR